MRHDNPPGTAGDHETPIAPFSYSPPEPGLRPPTRRRIGPRELRIALPLLGVALFAAFLLSAQAVRLQPTPDDARIDIDGGLQLVLGDTVLLRPGPYVARATAEGYYPLEQPFTVQDSGNDTLVLDLRKLPGKLLLATRPVAATALLDGAPLGTSNGQPLEIPAGTHRLRITADRYLAIEQDISIEGLGKEQSLALALAPAWGEYRLETRPPGASVELDGTSIGTTPTTLELLQGPRQLQVRLANHRDESLFIEAKAGESRKLDPLVLVRADARLRLSSTPAGASITLDGQFRGTAPLEIALESGKAHELIAFKAGHEKATRRFTAVAGEQQMNLALRALTGDVRISLTPADAGIYAGERLLARGSAMLTLAASPQTLTLRRAGHADETLRITPRPGYPQEFAVRLKTLAEKQQAAVRKSVRSAAGQELALIQPGSFRMGSSRRESGRRANEAMRDIRLTRAFYIGFTEVSNAEFRQFRSGHSSGNFKGKSLNGDTQPATNLSWTDAVLYCNWLSEREGLKPFYRMAGKAVAGFEPGSTGYRLPTEAEWAWVAAVKADGALLRFPWGDATPPPARAGNYADKSGESILGEIIAGYDDSFPVSAPVRSFAPDRRGLFDLGGNAAEWVHDIYEAAPGSAGMATDPLGADIGEYHVIRGASWRNGGVTELRLAFRDYGLEPRADVGFRIARYLK